MNKIKLKDVVDIFNGSTPSTSEPDYFDGDITWITPKDLSDQKSKYIIRGERSITKKGLSAIGNRLLPKGTILFSSRAPIGLISIAVDNICTNQGFKNMVCKEKKVNNEYLYYYLKTKISEIQELGTGTTFKEISKTTLENFEIYIEDNVLNQQKIAAVLSCLDDKIELNNQINAELELMAKTLYDYWFVQFEFPDKNGKPYKTSGGKMVWNEVLKREIPEGWEDKSFNHWISATKAGDWGKEQSEGNYTEHVFCVRGADINGLNGKGEIKAPERYILKSNLSKCLKPYDFIIEISGGSPSQSTARIALLTEKTFDRFGSNVICSNFCKAVSLKDEKYIFNFQQEWLRLYDAGIFFGFEGKTSGIKNFLFESFIESYRVAFPPKKIVEQFHSIVKSLEEKRQSNLLQNQQLASLRDWLLPLMMNGQVTVADAEEQMQAVVKETPIAKPKNDAYAKIQLLYATIWANKEIGVKQGEMATAKDVYLQDRIYGIPTGFQFAQHNWGSFDPEEKKLLNTKQYFHKPNFPNSKAVYLDLKDEGKLLDKIPASLKEQVSHAIQEMNTKVFNRYFGTQKAEKKELFATVLKCIEDRQSLDLAIIRDEMTNWKIKQGEKTSTKAEKFTEAETLEALEIIVHEKWFERVMR